MGHGSCSYIDSFSRTSRQHCARPTPFLEASRIFEPRARVGQEGLDEPLGQAAKDCFLCFRSSLDLENSKPIKKRALGVVKSVGSTVGIDCSSRSLLVFALEKWLAISTSQYRPGDQDPVDCSIPCSLHSGSRSGSSRRPSLLLSFG